jgi:hypothetical protein
MKPSLKLPGCIWFVLVLAPFSWSHGFSTECPKLTEPLCANVQAKSNSDTVWVNIILRASFTSNHDSCLYSNPNKNPDSNCVDRMDSAFWAKLKRETVEAYAKYSPMMLDIGHPSQRIPYPGDSVGTFFGVLITKSNLYAIVQDTTILGAYPFYFQHTLKLVNPQMASHSGNRNGNRPNFSVDGRLVPIPSRRLPLERPLPRP